LDPTHEEEKSARSLFTFAVNPKEGDSSLILASSCISLNSTTFLLEDLEQAFSYAQKTSFAINSAMRNIMSNKLMPQKEA
jgi:hypothetical protein